MKTYLKSGVERLNKTSSYKGGRYNEIGISESHKIPTSPDSIERRRIHEDIKRMIRKHHSKEEIISYLLKTYTNSTVKSFFETYVDYHFEREER